MLKIHVFGTCSGMEPREGRHHTAWALEKDGFLYWFDAGENCSRIAHLKGVDLLKIREIVISHPHMDHVGGLGNLLWNMRKLTLMGFPFEPDFVLNVHTPSMTQLDAVWAILKETEGGFTLPYTIRRGAIADGLVLDRNGVRVTAYHNRHIFFDRDPEDGLWRSFSFAIEAEGKKIVYSGDVDTVCDMEPLFRDGCDLLMMETGHHSPDVVCQTIVDQKYPIRKILFVHHGSAVLGRGKSTIPAARRIFPGPVTFAEEGMTYLFQDDLNEL